MHYAQMDKLEYRDARQNIKSGDLLAWSSRGWWSWHAIEMQLIRFFTRSEYNHVGIAWVIGGRVFVLEAVSPVIRFYPLSKCGDFYLLPMNAPWSDAALDCALNHLGEDYSEMDAVSAVFHDIDHKTVNQCATYVRHVYEMDKIYLGNCATPAAIVREAQQQGAECIYIYEDSIL